MTTQTEKTTPMMLQWHACKEQAKDAILLFRLGDFYEAFYDDAKLLSRELELTLTKRQDIPMSGIPHHSSSNYIDRLVAKGYRVAIAEQTEDPKLVKGLVKREVVRYITPGTLIDSTLLSDRSNNYFSSITCVGKVFGLAVLDVSTGEFFVSEFIKKEDLCNELFRLKPSEILLSKNFKKKETLLIQEWKNSLNIRINTEDDWLYDHHIAYATLKDHFSVHTLDGFGVKEMVAAINAAGALIAYLKETLHVSLSHIFSLKTHSIEQTLLLDRTTESNLELTESLATEKTRKNTLLSVIDTTQTPMGGRLLKRWLKSPLLNIHMISQRQEAISTLLSDAKMFELLHTLLGKVRDLERLMMKISSGYASPRDIVALKDSLEPIHPIIELLLCPTWNSTYLQSLAQRLNPCSNLIETIYEMLVDNPPHKFGEGDVFKKGVHKELDELKDIQKNSKEWLLNYQKALREKYNIKTLKVGFNKMFGYYIEVSKGQIDKVPPEFERKQTLVNAERYFTQKLKEFEQKILTAQERINQIESELFTKLRKLVASYAKQVLETATAIASIDSIFSLANTAKNLNWKRPIVDESLNLEIIQGRHPVVEHSKQQERFIPNDTYMEPEQNRLFIITGPNMAGKSTYIRQVALIVILAQIGSFIPAEQARIGLVDQIFTRIGASDDLARGQSTFMVEMSETANILNHATSRSLVILDEIGRGTSTYDGISIAWAVAEHLLMTSQKQARTLFATHYWELTHLEETVPGAVNYNIAVHEKNGQIVFLRKIIRGSTDKSYGIHVGRLAGLPLTVITRANEILNHLEASSSKKKIFNASTVKKLRKETTLESSSRQMTFFDKMH